MPAREKHESQDEKLQSQDTESEAQAAEDEELDFAEMDLTVEIVEERISPSETNVFDK